MPFYSMAVNPTPGPSPRREGRWVTRDTKSEIAKWRNSEIANGNGKMAKFYVVLSGICNSE